MAEANILAFGHDHVGHGQSEGISAYIESVDEYVDDLINHCQVMGHSNTLEELTKSHVNFFCTLKLLMSMLLEVKVISKSSFDFKDSQIFQTVNFLA